MLAQRIQLQHFSGKEDQADGGAGLRVYRVVGQIVVHGEGLSQHRGADAPGNVHPPLGDALPQRLAGGFQGRIPGFPGQVRHGGVEIDRPYRVSHRVFLLPDGLRALGVLLFHGLLGPLPENPIPPFLLFLKIVGLLAAHIYKMQGQLFVFLVAAGAVEAHQGQLDFRVAGVAPGAFLHEMLVDAVRVPLHDPQKAVLPRGLVMGAGGLHQVPSAVELVGLLKVRPALVRLLHGKIGIQVAIRMLGLLQQADHFFQPGLQLRVLPLCQRVGRGLHPLGQIAVLEHHTIVLALDLLPGHLLGRQPQVLDGVALFHPGQLII